MDGTAKIFAENLRIRRCELKLTQKNLADQLQYSEKSVSKWESGTAIPPSILLPELAEALHTTIDALFDCADEPLFFLGIDGGGTKTAFALADRTGTIVRRTELGSSNPMDVGIEETEAVFAHGIATVCDRISLRKVSVFAGISGGITGNNRKAVHDILNRYAFARIENGSDAQSAVALGLGDRDGVAMISGTGSVAFSQRDGQTRRFGGFGALFDHGGNGFTIGRDAIIAALQAEEGSAPSTRLHHMLLDRMNCQSMLELLPAFYAGGKRKIASYTPLVFDAYKQGDRVAAQILHNNVRCMAELMETAAKPLLDRKPVNIVLVGGLTHQAEVLRAMLGNYFSDPEAYIVSFCHEPVVTGALLLAGMPRYNAEFS